MGKGSTKSKLRRKKKLRAKAAAAVASSKPNDSSENSAAAAAASDYLEQWMTRDEASSAWKFNKTRQTFLLKGWPHRHRVSGETFKLLLGYVQTLPDSTAQRTAEQAREVAASAEKAEQALEARAAARRELAADAAEDDEGEDGADDDDGVAELEEKRAVLKIQQARALRVLNSLVAAGGRA